jgi:hypothetical protein
MMPDFSFPSSSFAVSQLDFGTCTVNCRVCGHAVAVKDEFCGNCGMDPDETEEALSDDKRGPRSVLAILKAQFKLRANGR